MDEDETLALLEPYLPFVDGRGRTSEPAKDYVRRMQATVLPNWPEEVLVEWLHRHAMDLTRYAFLDFRTLSFTRETWPVEKIPGWEAYYDDHGFREDIEQVQARADAGDWVPQYVIAHGTWNTPIILLHNPFGNVETPYAMALRSPYHLIEGHCRLSALIAVREAGLAQPEHELWIAEWNR